MTARLTDLTFIIKTIHRPWCCHRLVRSIKKHAPEACIHVLDDGRYAHRFTTQYAETAESCDVVIDCEEFDIGISAGRNRLIDTVKTDFLCLLDDDHILNESSDPEGLLQKITNNNVDIASFGGKSRCFAVAGRRVFATLGGRKTKDGLEWCDLIPNCFVARSEVVQTLRWWEPLKTAEHWEFFWRAFLEGVTVAAGTEHHVDHRHVQNRNYNPLRYRDWHRKRGLTRHNLRSFTWRRPPDNVEAVEPQRLSSRPRVLFVGYSRSNARHWRALHRHFERKGFQVDCRLKCSESTIWLESYSQIIIRNGEQPGDRELAEAARRVDVPVLFLEMGYFSQKSHFMLTTSGSVAGALLSDRHSLTEITESQEKELQDFFEQYSAGASASQQDYLLGILQFPSDTAIQKYSRFKNMQHFMDEVESTFPNDDIVFRPHPRDKGWKTLQPKRARIERTPSIWQQIMPAREIIGVNSTTLYEAALAGKKVTALGECPLRRWPSQHREIVREIISMQIPVDCDNLDPYLESLNSHVTIENFA